MGCGVLFSGSIAECWFPCDGLYVGKSEEEEEEEERKWRANQIDG